MKADLANNQLGHYAGFISRLMAFLIDLIITLFTIVAVSWFFSVTKTVFQLSATWKWLLDRFPELDSLTRWLFNPLTGSFVALLFIIFYHATFISILGQTPGKLLVGLRVLTIRGHRVPFWRAVLRVLGYFPSVIAIYLGFLWVLIDDRRQAWHDKLAGTYVVYAWSARPDERFLGEFIDWLRKRTSRH
jgi:uncharacterized RDD family membrane protein YckC